MTHPIVRTRDGSVRGLPAAHGAVFHSVPYAAVPTGADRFRAPRPPAPWTGVRDATHPGATAPQPFRGAFGALDMTPYFGPGWVRGADYLTVDVHTTDTGSGAAPVMVFVHGGGFVAGSPQAALYAGDAFARDGVVVVRVGYRLGVAGFLHLPDTPDNRGLLDVLAALRWVQENIAAFGGDPANVTVFGQSAGAILLGGLLADDRSAGLLRRAVLQSGSGTAAFTTAQAQRITDAAMIALGTGPGAEMLAAVPDEDLVDVLAELAGVDLGTGTGSHPLGGITPLGLVLDEQPAAAIARGKAAEVELLIGSTTEEGALYLAPVGGLVDVTDADLLATAAQSHRDAAAVVAAYRGERPRATSAELRTAILSDGLFRRGTRRTVEARATASAATYAYEFGWRSDAFDGALGACHTVELPFVFETTGLPALHGPTALLGTGTPPAELATSIHAAWTGFAATGDPGWSPIGPDRSHVEALGVAPDRAGAAGGRRERTPPVRLPPG